MSELEKELAILAGGCFWCTEAVFKRLKGVLKVTPGYAGGEVENPSYEQVSSGSTGHAEAIEIEFNPKEISFDQLLEVFWQLHDPTTMNRQGNDVGTQYRSAIFFRNEAQKKVAEQSKQKIGASGMYKDPIVTEIRPFTNFYVAENYHQDFYDRNRDYPYCNVIIDPKIKKLYKNFGDRISS